MGRGETITTYESLKQSVFQVMEGEAGSNTSARFFNYFMIFLIVLNVAVVILETVPVFYTRYFWIFTAVDIISFAVFTIEYILRLWICTSNPVFKNPITGRIHYATTPFALIDLLAIAPFYLPFIIPIDLRFLRILRLFRIVRILKIGRYSEGIRTFGTVISRKKEQLIVAFSILLFAIVIASSLMYYAEHESQPELFGSIPSTMWWALVTLATVGYGDMYPVTLFGKVIGGIVLIVGIAIFALPTAILASGFFEEIRTKNRDTSEKQNTVICPACGHHFSPGDAGCHYSEHTETEISEPPVK